MDEEDKIENDDDYNDDKDDKDDKDYDYNDKKDDDGGFYLRLPQPPLPKASSSRDPHSLNLTNPDDDDNDDDDDDDDEGVFSVVCPRIRLHLDWSEVKSFTQPGFFGKIMTMMRMVVFLHCKLVGNFMMMLQNR